MALIQYIVIALRKETFMNPTGSTTSKIAIETFEVEEAPAFDNVPQGYCSSSYACRSTNCTP
jgi:hypothetical protein